MQKLRLVQMCVDSGAIFSPCRVWRYALHRTWEENKGHLVVIGLNPSTADESNDDNTVRRCIRFALREGLGGLWMLNLFGYRSTDPKALKGLADPIGPDNNRWLKHFHERSALTVAAWGVHGTLNNRNREVCELLGDNLYCFGVTKEGHPKHPLYLKKDVEIVRYGYQT